MKTFLTLVLCLWMPTVVLAQEADEGEAPPPAAEPVYQGSDTDMELFRTAYLRYSDRMEEIRAEIKRVVTHRYEEELHNIRSSYDVQTEEKEAEERAARLEAIREHENFISKYPDSPYTAHRMFRLATLYLEETDYQMAVDNADYRMLEEQFDAGEISTLPEPPGKNYARSIRLFKRLTADFPDYKYLDATYYFLGYCYADELSEQQDDELARATYHELVERLPDSRYAANGHFMLGEIYFEDLQFDEAIVHYTEVMNTGVEELYDRSLYKLAWAYYRKDDLDNAIPRFVQLIDFSDSMMVEEGKESQLKPESLKYLAISLVEQADDANRTPMGRAEAFFEEIGDREYKYEVLTGIDDVLWQQGRYDEELMTLERLQELYPFSPDNPDFQYKIMNLHYLKDDRDPEAAVQARIDLVERFKEGTPWWEANKDNPDALRAAAKYIEESLGDVARTYHASAQTKFTEPGEEPARSEYIKAAVAYRDYLDRFPFAKDAYETQYQISDCYFFAGEYEMAIVEYKKLDSYPDKTYQGDVLDSLAFAYEVLMNKNEGDYKANPSSLANMEIPLGDKPEQIPVIPISEARMNFIKAVDDLYAFDPTHKDIPRKQYIVAEIFYYHNQIDEARRRFTDILDKYPEKSFAAYVAGYMVDSYHKTGDVKKVLELCEHYLQVEMLGDDPEYWAERLAFYKVKRRNSQFKLAELAGVTDKKESARLFEAYYREYPDNENAAMALFNAALQYENAGNTVKSHSLYEEFLDVYGKDERAPSIFFRIAGQYERTMDLEKAIDYYTKVAALHPNYKDPETGENYTANAYYNAAFLSLGLKKYDQAAKFFLKYASYPDVEDIHEAYWRAAEAYNDGGNSKKALNQYQEYNRRYGDKEINRTMESLIKQHKIYKEQNNSRMIAKIEEQLLEAYHKAREAGVELNTVSVAAASGYAFPTLETSLFEYDKIKLPNTMKQEDLAPVLEEKKEMAKVIQEEASTFMATYPDFDHIMACLYIKASVIQKYAEMIYAWDPPYDRKIFGPKTEDSMFEFNDIVDEMKLELAEPFEIEAVKLFEMVLAKAREMKKNSPWVDKAREALHKVDPNTYPMLKPIKVHYDDSVYEPMPQAVAAPVEETH